MLAIHCQALVKTYPGRPPVEAVRGIDLEVREGECFGVLGPNGAGKTTTIEILEGLLRPTAGTIEILGMSWSTHAWEIRERIGISLQETQFSDKLTVKETLRLFRSFYRRGVSAEEAIGRVSLEEKADTWVKKLSGGQRQRLAVAAALVGDPQVLFLDEPTTGLDPQSRRQLWDIVQQCRAQGRTVLLTTHYMEEAERLCDRVAIVDQGRVIALGSPAQLIASLGGDHVLEFTLEPPEGPALALPDWRSVAGVTQSSNENGRHRLSVQEPHRVLPLVLDELERHGLHLAGLATRHASLDDVFVQLTGRTLQASEEGAHGTS